MNTEDIDRTALNMLRTRKNPEEWATDHAFGNDPGPSRTFWLLVRNRIIELSRVRVGKEAK